MSGEAREETIQSWFQLQSYKDLSISLVLPYKSSQRWVNCTVHKAGHMLKPLGLYFSFGLYFTQVWSELLHLF